MKTLLAVATLLVLPIRAQQTTLRAWGDDAFGPTLTALERAYHAQHPEISFTDKLTGTGTGMAGIITGVSDITIMGRPADTNEVIGFEWVHRSKPFGIQAATGPLRGEGRSPALAVLVSRANPIANITIAQLASILTCAPSATAVTWALAGATGAFAQHPIHVYTYDITTGTGAYLQQTITPDRDCWNWDIVREFRDSKVHGKSVTAAAQIAAAMRHDPDGLAIAALPYASSGVKPISVNGVLPTVATVTDGRYPLSRSIYLYLERKADKPIDRALDGFLHFILSPEGQHIIAAQGDFLPLTSTAVAAQLHKLE